MNFINLPNEIFIKICGYLPVSNFLSIRQVCKKLNTLLDDEQLWKFLCFRDYHYDVTQIWVGWTYQNFYSKVLHRFRHLVGLWKRNLKCYGGLIKIEVTRDGVCIYDCMPPIEPINKSIEELGEKIRIVNPFPSETAQILENMHKLRYRLLFRFEPKGSDSLICLCYQSIEGYYENRGHSPMLVDDVINDVIQQHENKLEKLFDCVKLNENHKTTKTPFILTCQKTEAHIFNPDFWWEIEHGFISIDKPTQDYIMNEILDRNIFDRSRKFKALEEACTTYDLEPLSLQTLHCFSHDKIKNMPLKPGLYVGRYAGHGWEIFDIRYNDDFTCLEGTKITGDQNVFAGKLSFRIFLNKPLHFSKEDQKNKESLESAINRCKEEASVPVTCSEGQQSFVVPEYYSLDADHPLPDHCLSRFEGETQVAFELFETPSFIPCVCSVFDNKDYFALVWLELYDVTPFYRINNI